MRDSGKHSQVNLMGLLVAHVRQLMRTSEEWLKGEIYLEEIWIMSVRF